MKPLLPKFEFNTKILDDKFFKLTEKFIEHNPNRDVLRDKVLDSFSIKKLSPELPDSLSLLAVDSSLVKKELMFHVFWGINTIALKATFDGKNHDDPLANGKIRYSDLMYELDLDLGELIPYSDVDKRLDSIRILKECKFLLAFNNEIDYLLFDGSLYTTLQSLRKKTGYEKYNSALQVHEELLKTGKVIGMVEDSHSTDIAGKLGLNGTNTALFEIILEENEYIISEQEGIHVCYIKLPVKNLNYTLSKKSKPLTVRWEFSHPEFLQDLKKLVGIWYLEDDLLHPQIYPLRLADYLTRRIKIGGILDELIRKNDLAPRYREMREG